MTGTCFRHVERQTPATHGTAMAAGTGGADGEAVPARAPLVQWSHVRGLTPDMPGNGEAP